MSYTQNYGFEKIDFNTRPWDTKEYANWDLLDKVLSTIALIPGNKGSWQNSTSYAINDTVFDPQQLTFWQCVVAHTSPATGGFNADRILNPSRWMYVAQTAGAVRYDVPATLTDTQGQTARNNIYAADVTAYGSENLVINGSGSISQELGAAAYTVPANVNTYGPDMWTSTNLGIYTGGLLRVLNPFTGVFPKAVSSVQLYMTNTQASLLAGDVFGLVYRIEGSTLAKLGWGAAGAAPLTFGAFIRSTLTGKHSISFYNPTGPRNYIKTVDLVAGVAKFVNFTIPPDVGGAIPNTTALGLLVRFSLLAGSNFQGPSDVWSGNNHLSTPDSVQGNAALNNIIVSSLVLLPGTITLTADMLPYFARRSDEDLRACLRYWQAVTYSVLASTPAANTYHATMVALRPFMRALPSAVATPILASNASAPVVQNIGTLTDTLRVYVLSIANGSVEAHGTLAVNARI